MTKLDDWYDHPQYFDMVFRDETPAEVAFFKEAFKRYCDAPVQRLVEPGCGSGRLVAALAAEGYQCCGLDLSEPMLRYLRSRLRRRGLSAQVIQGDMIDMPVGDQIFDAAFCTFNTFRHLSNDGDAVKHLRRVADHVRVGGLYLLGFHIIPMDADPECTERWQASAGGTKVHVTLKVIDFDRKQRRETLRVSIKATRRSGAVHRVRSEFPLRLYTASQAKRLLAKVADVWTIREIFDFDYDIDSPRKFDDDLTDALFVLQRTGD
ncbi:class I SAM-dependent methyltransferase [Crateriforma spongiae]|uniref:class I SAM-dependent methyltransferase n=1 Tax=Crateriforma spongiae TaxID=2724528 RepID=UPI0028F444F6|nr:methyltransferase domain-containing protein [Crateriforma spongiae]